MVTVGTCRGLWQSVDKHTTGGKCFLLVTTIIITFTLSHNPQKGAPLMASLASSIHLSLFFPVLWELTNSSPVHSLMLSSHLFSLPSLPPLTVPCKVVFARPDDHEMRPYHDSQCFLTIAGKSLCGPGTCFMVV